MYKFFGSRVPEINRRWIDSLMQTANSAAGLHMTPEPTDHGDADPVSLASHHL